MGHTHSEGVNGLGFWRLKGICGKDFLRTVSEQSMLATPRVLVDGIIFLTQSVPGSELIFYKYLLDEQLTHEYNLK